MVDDASLSLVSANCMLASPMVAFYFQARGMRVKGDEGGPVGMLGPDSCLLSSQRWMAWNSQQVLLSSPSCVLSL